MKSGGAWSSDPLRRYPLQNLALTGLCVPSLRGSGMVHIPQMPEHGTWQVERLVALVEETRVEGEKTLRECREEELAQQQSLKARVARLERSVEVHRSKNLVRSRPTLSLVRSLPTQQKPDTLSPHPERSIEVHRSKNLVDTPSPCSVLPALPFGVWGLGFRVWDSGFGFRIQGS